MHKRPVLVEGQVFDSVKAAADYLGTGPENIRYVLRTKGSYKGLTVRDIENHFTETKEEKMEKTYTMPKHKGTSVTASNGTHYVSLKQLAQYIQVPDHVISNALSKRGKFIYKDVVYVADKPRAKRNRTSKYAEIYAENPGVQPGYSTTSVVPTVKDSNIETAKTLLKNKISAYIQKDNFEMAKELMSIVEQIKE